MKNRQSLPGIKFIGMVPAKNLQRQIMYKHLAGISVGIFSDVIPIDFIGVPTCEAVSTYNNNGRLEQTNLRFCTLDEVPTNKHLAFVVTDCNNNSFVIGQHEKPRPIVKISQNTGTPEGDPSVFDVEVTLYAQKSLIPCTLINS